MKETVYILSHPHMVGLVKIGMTSKPDASQRVRELSSSTSVPSSFVLEYELNVDNALEVEKGAHYILSQYRISGSEFFKVTVDYAKEAVLKSLNETKKSLEDKIKLDESSSIFSMEDIGQKIRKVRKQQGLTQSELAMVCNVGITFISELERGKPTVQMDKVFDICRGLGIKIYFM